MKDRRNIKNLRVAVIGAGRTGRACAKFLLDRGAEVFLSDPAAPGDGLEGLGKAGLFFGERSLLPFRKAELAVASPGVPSSSPQVASAHKNGVDVISEIELFSWFCDSQVIAVTGTNGKTTTAFLISELMNALGHRTLPAGNTGIPLTALSPSYYDGSSPLVCEISSFQLEHTRTFRPFVSIVLNVEPDHLYRHGGFAAYALAKSRLVRNQEADDYAVLNRDCPVSRDYARHTRAKVIWLGKGESPGDCVRLYSGRIMGRLGNRRIDIDAEAPGALNPYNAMAAAAAGLVFGADSEKLSSALKSFRGLEHRREFVAEISGVSFYNDSKATNSAAFLDGLRALGKNVVVISGGRDKGENFSFLKEEVALRVKKMVLIGESAGKFSGCFRDAVPCFEAGGLPEAVTMAFEDALPGDKVALLPGCSSFDMFRDFEERGRAFKERVMELKSKVCGCAP